MTILNDEMMGWNRSFKLGSYSQGAIYSHGRDRSADKKNVVVRLKRCQKTSQAGFGA
jgi:hypothetical protein